jgi:hypothetical protein
MFSIAPPAPAVLTGGQNIVSSANADGAPCLQFTSRDLGGKYLHSDILFRRNESTRSVLTRVQEENLRHEAERGGCVGARKLVRRFFYSEVLSYAKIEEVCATHPE